MWTKWTTGTVSCGLSGLLGLCRVEYVDYWDWVMIYTCGLAPVAATWRVSSSRSAAMHSGGGTRRGRRGGKVLHEEGRDEGVDKEGDGDGKDETEES